jgi:hypothetical protein
MDDQITGDQIEAFFRSRLKMLSHMDNSAIYDATVARRQARIRDKAEWEALDEECKLFLRDHLAMKTE